jgi:hypothetical protein
MSTAPRARCPAKERSEVGTITAKRGADGEMHPHGLIDPKRSEQLIEHRHEDAAAADAEQPGEHPGDDPGREQRRDQHRRLP